VEEQQFFLNIWPILLEYFSQCGGCELKHIVTEDDVLPDRISIVDKEYREKILLGKNVNLRFPSECLITIKEFPILAVLPASQLEIFSPIRQGKFDFEKYIRAENIFAFDSVIRDQFIRRPELFKRQAMREAFEKSSFLGTVGGDPKLQFSLGLAARRLFDLCKIYDDFLDNEALYRGMVKTFSEPDRFGKVDLSVASMMLQRQVSIFDLYDEKSVPSDILAFIQLKLPELPKAPATASWQDFERDCLTELVKAGYEASLTPSGADFGADIVATKDGLTYVVQCKRYAAPVGVKGVQEIVSARRYYKADYGVVVSDAGFTNAAFELARENGVGLAKLADLAQMGRLF
jgi:hypothetical protein